MLASKLQGMAVYSKDMSELGNVEDIEIDPVAMEITHLVIELEDEAAKRLFGRAPLIGRVKGKMRSDLVESIGDAIILKHTFNGLKGKIQSL